MMKLIKVAIIATAGLMIAACTPEQRAANEAKAQQIIAAIKSGVKVANSAVNEAMDVVCTNGSLVNTAAMGVRVGLGTQQGPNTTQNLANLDRAIAALNTACARIAANPNDPAIKSVLLTAWQEYQRAKTAASNLGV